MRVSWYSLPSIGSPPLHRRFVLLHPRPRRRETYHIMFFFAKESVLIFIFMSCVVMMLSHSVLHIMMLCTSLERERYTVQYVQYIHTFRTFNRCRWCKRAWSKIDTRGCMRGDVGRCTIQYLMTVCTLPISWSEFSKKNQRTFYRKEKCWVLIYVW